MQVDRRLHAVDAHVARPFALRHLGDLRQHGVARAFDDVGTQHLKVVQPVLAQHGGKPALAGLIAGHQGVEVALHLHRFADIDPDQIDQRLIHHALTRQRHDRDAQAFVEHLPAIRRQADAADIHDMHGAGEQPDHLAVVKSGRGDDDVVQMPGAHPGVVGKVVVALTHRLGRNGGQEVLHAARHGIHMAGRAGDSLRQHAPLHVEHAGRDVASLARRGGEGGADEGAALLLDDGEQPVPHDLEADVVHGRQPRAMW